MDWNQSTMYEQRVRFILEVQQRTFSFAESCRRYGISRTAGYTWWNRFLVEGFEGLHDRSHRPHHCPHAIAEGVVEHDRPPIVVPPTVLVQPPPEAWGEGRRVSGVSGRPDRAGSLPEPGAGSPESYEDGWCCTRAATVR